MIDKKTVIDFCEKWVEAKFSSPKTKLDYYLWSPREVEKLNSEYKVEELLPNFIAFGSDGGGEMLVVNKSNGKVYTVPFIPMEEKEAVEVASSLDEFVNFRRD